MRMNCRCLVMLHIGFLNCFAKWPKSEHDFRVFKDSLIARIFETSEYINLKIEFYKQKQERKTKIHTFINIFHALHFSFHFDGTLPDSIKQNRGKLVSHQDDDLASDWNP